MTERMILAGWGGQGMMLLGKLIANIAMRQDKHVTYFPSYGAEVRGGTAHCQVVISDEPIYSPIVEHADTLLIMNQPSYGKFNSLIAEDGLMLQNSSMISMEEPHEGCRIIRVPATDIANDMGEVRVGNMVMLGAYTAVRDYLPRDEIEDVLRSSLTGRKAKLISLNMKALEKGYSFAATCSETTGA